MNQLNWTRVACSRPRRQLFHSRESNSGLSSERVRVQRYYTDLAISSALKLGKEIIVLSGAWYEERGIGRVNATGAVVLSDSVAIVAIGRSVSDRTRPDRLTLRELSLAASLVAICSLLPRQQTIQCDSFCSLYFYSYIHVRR